METKLLSREAKKQLVANDGISRTTLSFYAYVRIDDPHALREELLAEYGRLGCMGRIYVAHEGINAQMNVPTTNFAAFDTYMKSKDMFADIPYKIAVEEGEVPSFYKLTIKVREKIVADGLRDDAFEVTNTGTYLTAEEMNAYLDDPDAIVVDMRNAYESEIGHFDGAITPQVETFREELAVVPELLRVHKNKKIALYCTGGIRCEKASAWLKHNGFEQVAHLRGGIIDYARQVREKKIPNRFKGKNFVFDERLGERVGDEVISHCHLCKTAKSDTHYHCKNEVCHTLFLGCEACVSKKDGYCSYPCAAVDRMPDILKRMYARQYNRFVRSAQFRKRRLRA